MKHSCKFATLVVITVFIFILYYFYLTEYSVINYYTVVDPVIWKSVHTNDNEQHTPFKKWILTPYPQVKQLNRNRTEQKIRADVLVLQRSILLFSVHTINLKLVNTPCAKWWANPFSITKLQQESPLSSGGQGSQYRINYEAQPGRVPFQSLVVVHKNLPNASHPYVSDDFVFISGRRLDLDYSTTTTTCPEVNQDIRHICLCPDERGTADHKTLEVRKRWRMSDPEHPDWPVDAPAMVPEFLNVGHLDVYRKEPSSTLGICGDVQILVFISCAPSHGERRQAIRATYGNPDYLKVHRTRLIFSFGAITNPAIQKGIDEESMTYGDILQSNFVDHYQNQSLSELFVYNWIVTRCDKEGSMPMWILKADDDSFLNIPLVRRVVDANPTADIIGCQDCPHGVQRGSKAAVPRYMYAPDYWFGFVYGGAALMRADILRPLLKASLTSPIINLCDVYITGVLAKQIGAHPLNSPLFQTNLIVRETSCTRLKFMVNTHVKTTEDMERYWKAFHEPTTSQCTFNDHFLLADPLTPNRKLDCFYD